MLPTPTRAPVPGPDPRRILHTPRLRLEPLTMAHFEQLYYLNSDLRVMQYITGRKVTFDETLSHMDMIRDNWRDLGFSAFAVIAQEDQRFVGSCGMQHIEYNLANPVEIGWRLRPEYWGNGYAIEAAIRLLRFAWEQTDVTTLYAIAHPENAKSLGVMRRLGMHAVGVQRWYDIDTLVYRIERVLR